jgi:mono/diheme cytochrome c family protein
MNAHSARRVLAATATFAFLACGSGDPPDGATSSPPQKAPEATTPSASDTPPSSATPDAGSDEGAGPGNAAGGAQSYATYCASCHGANGDGNTPIAQALDPPPVAHSDGSYMNDLSDDYLFRVVKEGGAAVGKSPMMAAWGGAMSDAQIRNVVAFMRTLADPPYEPTGP